MLRLAGPAPDSRRGIFLVDLLDCPVIWVKSHSKEEADDHL